MNGRELAAEVRKLRPDLPVLFTTGYADDSMFQRGRLDDNAELLTKPFNRTRLAEQVRRLLDA
jgi:FixJ family two-component response regulator